MSEPCHAKKRRTRRAALPRIRLTFDETISTAKAVRALARRPEVYQRSGALVTIEQVGRRARRGGLPPESLTIRRIPIRELGPLLSQSARYLKLSKRTKRWEETSVPRSLVLAVASLGTWPGVRPLDRITEMPVIRPDGTPAFEHGYDAQTGIYFAPPPLFNRVFLEMERRYRLTGVLGNLPTARPSRECRDSDCSATAQVGPYDSGVTPMRDACWWTSRADSPLGWATSRGAGFCSLQISGAEAREWPSQLSAPILETPPRTVTTQADNGHRRPLYFHGYLRRWTAGWRPLRSTLKWVGPRNLRPRAHSLFDDRIRVPLGERRRLPWAPSSDLSRVFDSTLRAFFGFLKGLSAKIEPIGG